MAGGERAVEDTDGQTEEGIDKGGKILQGRNTVEKCVLEKKVN